MSYPASPLVRRDAPLPVRGAGRPCRVSLTLIVRDEEANLPRCLESIRGLFDEQIIVDTGSTDRTKEVASSFGAKVFDFGWCDDFSKARNAAIEHATGDMIFCLDADDSLDPPQREKLRGLLDALRPGEQVAHLVRADAYRADDGTPILVDSTRLFPRRPDLRWSGRCHEQIDPSLMRAGVPIAWPVVTIRHRGYDDPATLERKLARNAKLLLREFEERPRDSFLLYLIARDALEIDPTAAITLLREAAANWSPDAGLTRSNILTWLAMAYQEAGEADLALGAAREAVRHDPQDADAMLRLGVIQSQNGDPTGAKGTYRAVLAIRRPPRFEGAGDPRLVHPVARRFLDRLVASHRPPSSHRPAAPSPR